LEDYDYGFRGYDPQIGRFTEQDPLTDEFATVSGYQYALNDPVANIDVDGLGVLPTITITAQAVHRMSAFSQFTSKLLGPATLAGNIEHISGTGVHLLQAGTTAVNAWGVTSAIGEYAAAWPPWWEKLNTVLHGLWYNFENNTTQELSEMTSVGSGVVKQAQEKMYDYKHFNQETTKEKIQLIGETIQMAGMLAALEGNPEGVASEAEDLSQEVESAGEGLEEPKVKEGLTNSNKWLDREGNIIYPPSSGFEGTPERSTLAEGTQFDRYGYSNGTFGSPVGTSIEQRALPPGSGLKPLTTYEVIKPIDVLEGKVAPWFGEPGGGIQYKFNVPVQRLIREGFIKEIK
jgi:hypothetical protein